MATRRWGGDITRKEFLTRCLRCSAGLSIVPGVALAKGEEGDRNPQKGLLGSHRAAHFVPLPGGRIQCQLCPHQCVIAQGQRGSCGVRELQDGQLNTMVYGNPCAVHIDPIEKKPLLHFLPSSRSYSIATAGCNLHCKNCQNWEISQRRPEETYNMSLPPEDVVAEAIRSGCQSIAYTYSEPNIFFEYVLETATLARDQGVKNVLVTAGFINPDPQREFCQVVDAANVDLKGFSEDFYRDVCFARLRPVLDALVLYREEGVWLEVTNLIIPTLNDDLDQIRQMCHWLKDHLGDDVPLHFSRFQPRYQLKNLPPTPVEILEQARETALEVGLQYVYVGNVPGHQGENTFCPRCHRIVIGRIGYSLTDVHLQDGCCQFCGQRIVGVWDTL